MVSKIRLVVIFAIVLLIGLVPTHAQDNPSLDVPLAAISTGVLGDNQTVFYSVLLASGPDAVQDVTIAASVPADATFQDVAWTPDSAEFVGQADGVATWTMAELAADTIIGPFSISVTLAEDAVIPVNIPATVTYAGGEVDVEVVDGILEPADVTGTLALPLAGTEGELVEVGNTHIFVMAPANSFDQEVTLTFTQLAFEPGVGVPEGVEGYWWCSSVSVTVEPADATALQPLTVFLPTRRTLTPGMDLVSFVKQGEGDWQILGAETSMTIQADFAKPSRQSPSQPKVARDGNHVLYLYTTPRVTTVQDGTSNTIVLGVSNQQREQGTSSIIAILIGIKTTDTYNEAEILAAGLGTPVIPIPVIRR